MATNEKNPVLTLPGMLLLTACIAVFTIAGNLLMGGSVGTGLGAGMGAGLGVALIRALWGPTSASNLPAPPPAGPNDFDRPQGKLLPITLLTLLLAGIAVGSIWLVRYIVGIETT